MTIKAMKINAKTYPIYVQLYTPVYPVIYSAAEVNNSFMVFHDSREPENERGYSLSDERDFHCNYKWVDKPSETTFMEVVALPQA